MNKTTHTVLPWRLGRRTAQDDYTTDDVMSGNVRVANCYASNQVDAEFIVRACNTYYTLTAERDKLRKACEEALAEYDYWERVVPAAGTTPRRCSKLVANELRSALAAMEGDTE